MGANTLVGIIPCAGRGSRLESSKNSVPKPLVPIGGKPLVEHALALMRELEPSLIALIISSHTLEVQSHYGSDYDGVSIEYVMQESPCGLLDAVHRARDLVADKFINLLSDEIYVGCRHRRLIEYWSAHPKVDGMVGYIVSSSWDNIKKNYSIVMTDRRVQELEEKPSRQVNSYLGTGTWGLTKAFFEYAALTLTKNPPNRRSFVDALQLMIHDNYRLQGYDLGGDYINVNDPKDIERAESLVQSMVDLNREHL